MCEEWTNDFGAFLSWAESAGYKEGLTLDRINNDKGYSPENCRFATITEQSNNRSTSRKITAFGITDTLANTARKHGVNYAALQAALNRGVDAERAINVIVSKRI